MKSLIKISLLALAGMLAVWTTGCNESKPRPGSGSRSAMALPLQPVKGAMSIAEELPSDTEVNWLAWDESLLARAKKENRYILVDVYAEWCPPCKQMDAVTYADPGLLRRLNKKYLMVKINSDEDRPNAERFGTGSLPTTTIITPNEAMLFQEAGFFPPKTFHQILDHAEGLIDKLQGAEQAANGADTSGKKKFLAAEAHFEIRSLKSAITWYGRALASKDKTLSSDERQKADFNIGSALLASKQYEDGLAHMAGVIKRHPGTSLAKDAARYSDIGRYYLAVKKEEAGDVNRARTLYAIVAKTVYNDALAGEAARRLKRLEE